MKLITLQQRRLRLRTTIDSATTALDAVDERLIKDFVADFSLVTRLFDLLKFTPGHSRDWYVGKLYTQVNINTRERARGIFGQLRNEGVAKNVGGEWFAV